ncbi:MAG: HD domain-containing protein [Treponema sp.]|nr:HD domain-containing protein [Treponema sp.]
MVIDDKEFFIDNISYVNRLVANILSLTTLLTPAFAILSHYKIFDINRTFILLTFILTVPFSAIQLILVFYFGSNKFKQKHNQLYYYLQNFAMYFGLTISALILGILGTNAHIGIYISYAIIIFLSCLYYNTRVTKTMAILSYIIMLASMYFKSLNRVNEGMTQATLMEDFISYSAGFTIEFLFVFLITWKMTKRNHQSMEAILNKNIKIENTNIEIIKFIPAILKQHEIITGFHTEHTVSYVDMICRELKSNGYFTDVLTDENIKLFSAAANLHDIGKIFIPDHILNTPRRYTPQEYEMMKMHPQKGKEILESMPILWDGRFNKIAIDMAYCHHERFDGKGYPNGLKGEDIPLCARIMAVADVLDALLSRRPYKKEMSLTEAMDILEEGRGAQFDPVIVDSALSIQPLIYMYSQEVATKEYDKITSELEWRQQNMDSIQNGRVITEEMQKELMKNS